MRINKKLVVISTVVIIVLIIIVSALALKQSYDKRSDAASYPTYYLSPTGSDSNSGTLSSPFKTISKAKTVLTPGSTLNIQSGTYKDSIVIDINGTSTLPINIIGSENLTTIFDGGKSRNPIEIKGNYITIKNLKSINSKWAGVIISGSNITAENLRVETSESHGVYMNGQNITLRNSTVTNSVLEGISRGSWGSGIKTDRGATNIKIENSTASRNHGEGFGITMSKNVSIIKSTAFDNLSVNFYIDNSGSVEISQSYAYCTNDSTYYRGGKSASGISMGEEADPKYYSGWGYQLANVKIMNNIIANCEYGIAYFGADNGNGGLDAVEIVNNTFWKSRWSPIYLTKETAKTRNSVIANNIFDNSLSSKQWNENTSGIKFSNNMWSLKPDNSALVTGTNDIVGQPKFLTTPQLGVSSTYDITSASGTIDKGVVTKAIIDFKGTSRPKGSAYDIGHLEFSSTPTTPTTPTNVTKISITDDAFVSLGTSTNYGTSTSLILDSDPLRFSYLKLDLTQVKNSTFKKAYLNFMLQTQQTE